MKAIKKLLAGMAALACTATTCAQNGWFYGLDGASGNFFTSQVMELAGWGLNKLTGQNLVGTHIGFRLFGMKENGDEVEVKNGKFYGVRAADLFNDVEIGARVGYMAPTSPVGAYVSVRYGHERFQTRYLQATNFLTHKTHSFIPGVGIRISPLVNLLGDWNVIPFAEVGTSYVCRLKYEGSYGNDKSQLNNGMRTTYAIGLTQELNPVEYVTYLIGFEMDNFNYFNTNFSPDGGTTKPYAYTDTHNYYFYFKINYSF